MNFNEIVLPVEAFIIFTIKRNNNMNPKGSKRPITIANDTSGPKRPEFYLINPQLGTY